MPMELSEEKVSGGLKDSYREKSVCKHCAQPPTAENYPGKVDSKWVFPDSHFH